MTFSGSPRVLKGGIVLLDPASGRVQRVITLQYNPDSVTRTLSVRAMGGEQGDRSQALRIKAPPTETISLEAEIDATDQLEFPDRFPDAVSTGIHPQLAALETMLSPTSAQLAANDAKASSGTLEVVPMEAPLAVFVWSAQRIVPVRLNEMTVTEEAFDPNLNPIRAKIDLSFRVLTVDDLGFRHRGGTLFLAQLRRKEALSARSAPGSFATLGITGLT
jgi:Contractile injection system tube protein